MRFSDASYRLDVLHHSQMRITMCPVPADAALRLDFIQKIEFGETDCVSYDVIEATIKTSLPSRFLPKELHVPKHTNLLGSYVLRNIRADLYGMDFGSLTLHIFHCLR